MVGAVCGARTVATVRATPTLLAVALTVSKAFPMT
jgi:hypothetical protein